MSFVAKGKNKKQKSSMQNQDKQTPHTVLQKLSPKLTPTPLIKVEFYLMNFISNNFSISLSNFIEQLITGNSFKKIEGCLLTHPLFAIYKPHSLS